MICDNLLVKENIIKEFSRPNEPLNLDKYVNASIELQIYRDLECTKRVYPHFVDNLFITEDPKYCFGEEQISPFLKSLKRYLIENKNKHYYKIHFIFSDLKHRDYLHFEPPVISEDNLYNTFLRLFIDTYKVYEDITIRGYYD